MPKSLSPLGDTLPGSKQRLETGKAMLLKGQPDAETIMMKLWEKENIPRGWLNHGHTPIHAIMWLDATRHKKEPPRITDHDRQVIAATVQWLATSCGRSFYQKFQEELRRCSDVHWKARIAPTGRHRAS